MKTIARLMAFLLFPLAALLLASACESGGGGGGLGDSTEGGSTGSGSTGGGMAERLNPQTK